MNRQVEPTFSICVPHYGRTPFFLEALKTFAGQRFRDFEVCVSDGAAPEGGEQDIRAALAQLGVPFRFERQPERLRYDPNLRAAIGLASGQYCVLMGNDDALRPEALAVLAERIAEMGPCGVLIPDFEDFASGRKAHRIRKTLNCGAGPAVAATHFRNLSFVSGIVLRRDAAQALATGRWDGSEMYQTYLACRMIASGLPLLEIADSLAQKDIVIEGHAVDSYARRPRVPRWPVREQRLPLGQLGQVVIDAIGPYLKPEDAPVKAEVFRQLLRFTYPFWLVEYRRVQSWSYALGVAAGFRPSKISAGVALAPGQRIQLWLEWLASSIAGLLIPGRFFRLLQPLLYRLAKRS